MHEMQVDDRAIHVCFDNDGSVHESDEHDIHTSNVVILSVVNVRDCTPGRLVSHFHQGPGKDQFFLPLGA